MFNPPISIEEIVECPICGKNCNNNVLSSYTTEETARYFCPPTRNYNRYLRLIQAIKNLWQTDKSYLLRCGNCTFMFGYPFVGGDETFYGILHEQYGYPTWRKDYDIAIENVLNNFPGGNILDIGAGTGNFLKSLGNNWRAYAIEGSETTIKLLNDINIATFKSLSEISESKSVKFDVITLFQVLEHISEFNVLLYEAASLMNPNGYIIISVPDGKDMLEQEILLDSPDYAPNHINKFTEKSLTMALFKAGFEVINFYKTPSSIFELKSAVHVKMLSNAARKPNSLAAKIYKIQSKKIRTPFLIMLGAITFLQLLPIVKKIAKGRTLVAVAKTK